MKKIAISLIALAAVSTVALANSDRSFDPRDLDTYVGKYATRLSDQSTNSHALAVVNDGQSLTSFERAKKISEENQNGGH